MKLGLLPGHGGGLAPWSHHEVVLQLSVGGAVVDQVDAGVHVAEGHLAVADHVADPAGGVAAAEVVAAAGLLLQALGHRRRVGTQRSDAQGRGGVRARRARQDEDGLGLVGQEQLIAGGACLEGDAGIGLVPDFSLGSALDEGRVVTVLPEWDILEPYIGTAYAVYTPTRHVPPKVRAFVDHLAATAHDQPA